MSADALAEEIRARFLNQSFGILQLWGFGVWRPNDQSYRLVSTHADGDRLDLVFVHESGSGLPGVISLWEPVGLESVPAGLGEGLAIRGATRLRVDDHEAHRAGDQFRILTPRGEGLLPLPSLPALILAH